MYFENEQDNSRRRSGDEFLRRMKSEEFLSRLSTGNDIPTFSRTDVPRRDERPRTSCNGEEARKGKTGFTTETQGTKCHMPSLAMVYSPYQEWQNLLSLQEGLYHGSIFAELIKPFEGARNGKGSEGGCCK